MPHWLRIAACNLQCFIEIENANLMQKAVKYSEEVLPITFLTSGLTYTAACTGWKGVAAAEQDLSEQPCPS